MLLDSGGIASIVSSKVVQDLDTERAKFTAFQTIEGTFNTTHTCKTESKVLELNQSAEVCKKTACYANEWKVRRNNRPRRLNRTQLSNQLLRRDCLLEQIHNRYEAP